MNGGGTSRALLLVAAFLISPAALRSQEPGQAEVAAFETPEGTITALYTAVSGTPDALQDWHFVRSLFLDEAVVVLRSSRTETSVFSLDGFIQDFQQFMEYPGPKEAGFQERIVRMRPWVYREMARVLVLYEAHVPGSPRPPQQGVDSFLLVRQEGRWRVAAITNEIVDADHPVPEELR